MSQSGISQLTKIPFGSNEPLLHRALEAGGVGLWDYTPSNGMIDLYHNVFRVRVASSGRYYGPLSEFTSYIAAEDPLAVERLLKLVQEAGNRRFTSNSGCVAAKVAATAWSGSPARAATRRRVTANRALRRRHHRHHRRVRGAS